MNGGAWGTLASCGSSVVQPSRRGSIPGSSRGRLRAAMSCTLHAVSNSWQEEAYRAGGQAVQGGAVQYSTGQVRGLTAGDWWTDE